jgi:hypothetical protein
MESIRKNEIFILPKIFKNEPFRQRQISAALTIKTFLGGLLDSHLQCIFQGGFWGKYFEKNPPKAQILL